MNTIEINDKISKFENFSGVYALDKLPEIKDFPVTLISNTDPSDQEGQHWIAIYIGESGFGEFFDSYGLPPLKKEFYEFMDANCSNGWSHSTVLLQDLRSKTCGKYAMLFCALRSYSISMCSLINLFSNSGEVNEEIITDLYKAIFE